MTLPLQSEFTRIHLVGVGGVGMEGLARILRDLGLQVSGSDLVDGAALQQLRREGVEVHAGHRAEYADGADLVVYSSAVPDDNQELERARQRGIPAIKRAELLGKLGSVCRTVAIAGSHGKTTTAAMVAAICRDAGLDPATAVGGRVGGKIEAGWGGGKCFVVEADEFDRSFLRLQPRLAVVTCIDSEHLEYYGDLAAVQATFLQFLARLPFHGQAILAGDDVGVRGLMGQRRKNWLTYGIEEENDYRAVDVKFGVWGLAFTAVRGGKMLERVDLQVPGEHNLLNALAAVAVGDVMDIQAAAALAEFPGVDRRLQRLGEVGGILVVDDYAHHPAEIAAALAAARRCGRRLVVAFQPHLYSRTRAFVADFAQVLRTADRVYLTAIYGARETRLPGVDAFSIARQMREDGYTAVDYIPIRAQLAPRLARDCRAGDLVLTMGAGDIDNTASELLELLAA